MPAQPEPNETLISRILDYNEAKRDLWEQYPDGVEKHPDDARHVTDELTEWVREQTGRDDLTVEVNTDPYPDDDPKSPRYHSTHADLWDARDRS